MAVKEGKSAVTPLNFLNTNKAQLDLLNEVHYVSELPLVQKIQAVKVEKTKKSSISICKRTFFRFFNFDGSYFWNYWEFRDVMYLILKVWSMVKWSQKLKGVTALLLSATPFWKKPFYRGKGQIVPIFFCLSVTLGHTAPPEELGYIREASVSYIVT